MGILETVINTPLAQLFGLAILIAVLQKAGIDVVGMLSKLFSKNGNGSKPTWAEELIQHFNHETTENLQEVRKLLERHDQLERETLALLKEILKYGVQCRKTKAEGN